MNTVENWDMRNCNQNEKEDSNGMVPRVLKPNKLTGHKYKQWLKFKGIKAKGSDLSIEKKSNSAQGEVNATEPNSFHIDENGNADNSVSHPQEERLDFLLRRVNDTDPAKESNSPNGSTQTKDISEKNNDNPETLCKVGKSEVKKDSEMCSAHMSKSTKPSFVEYWVPVSLSEMQTELYCGSLFSNACILTTHSKNASRKSVLNDMLLMTRKCCDHPYLVDRSLSTSLLRDVEKPELMDAEIKLSTKLLLLHKILVEIRKRGLRVLILYQSHGDSGLFSIGDLLDAIIHEKFGSDLYERIGGRGRVPTSRRQAALNTFNDKDNGKFVCLMETNSCIPSVKLASVQIVIFFNSDWNPTNDLRALRRIDLDSQLEHVKVFRLYSSHTLEEKILILAKQGMAPEGIIMDMKLRISHQLLTWGASHLFKKLDEFHNFDPPDGNSAVSSEDTLGDVFLELLNLMPGNEKSSICENQTSLIVEVRQIEGAYPGHISLLGESENPQEMIPKKPHLFWKTLLKGRNPKWKYFSSQSRRTSKTMQRFYDVLDASARTELGPRKRRRKARTTVYQIPTNIKRKIRSKHQNQGGGKFSSMSNDVKYFSEETNKRRKVSSWVSLQSPVLGRAPQSEHHSLLPGTEQITTQKDGHSHGTPTWPLVEDPIWQSDSFVQHPIGEDGRESSAAHDASVFLTSLNSEPPPEASHVAPQSVCKALQIELEVLQKQKNELLKLHEEKKLQMKMACEKEIEQIREKYDVLLQNAEMALLEEKGVLEAKCRKVQVNKSLAEAVRQNHTLESPTLAEVTANCSSNEMYNLFHQWTRAETVTGPTQVAKPLPTAERTIQASIPSTPESFSTLPNPACSSYKVNLLQISSSVAAGPNQPLPGRGTMGLSSSLTPMVQIPRTLVDGPVIPPNSKAITPFNFSENFLAGSQARGPAPHLRHIWSPQSYDAWLFSYPGQGIFSPVSLRPVTAHMPDLQSTFSSFWARSPFAGLPLFDM